MAKQTVFVVMGWDTFNTPDLSTLQVFTSETEAYAYGNLLRMVDNGKLYGDFTVQTQTVREFANPWAGSATVEF